MGLRFKVREERFTSKLEFDPDFLPFVTLADPNFVAISQINIFCIDPIDQYTVAASQVYQPIPIFFTSYFQMPARDRLEEIRQDEVVALFTASYARDFAQAERFLPFIRPMDNDLCVLEE